MVVVVSQLAKWILTTAKIISLSQVTEAAKPLNAVLVRLNLF